MCGIIAMSRPLSAKFLEKLSMSSGFKKIGSSGGYTWVRKETSKSYWKTRQDLALAREKFPTDGTDKYITVSLVDDDGKERIGSHVISQQAFLEVLKI